MMPILAHGSGIDDIAWFVVPIVVALVALRWAERRARRRAGDATRVDVPAEKETSSTEPE